MPQKFKEARKAKLSAKQMNKDTSPLFMSWTAFILLVVTICVPHLYTFIDEKIDGKWSHYPPFSFLKHPHHDFQLTGEEIIAAYGFNVESHYTTTEDGYINHMFRLNKFTNDRLNDTKPKAAVMFVHGHLDSSDTWIVNGERSYAFILADAGYDVYLHNTRGNKYSMGHVKYDSAISKEYWEGCQPDNQAKYDISAAVELIKDVSKVDSVSVISHSLGSRSMILNLEQNKTYYSKNINYLVLLSPFIELHETTLINNIIMSGSIWMDEYLSEWLHWYQSFKHGAIAPPIVYGFKWVCGYADWYCNFLNRRMSETTSEFNDAERTKIFFSKYPGQSTYKNWHLFTQLMKYKEPKMYDLGEEENMKVYGQKVPKTLNITKTGESGVPISMFAMKHDMMLPISMSQKINQAIGDSVVGYKELNGGHSTYFVGYDVTYIREDIIPQMMKFNPLS